MEVITDGSGDGIALPFTASFACNAPSVKRPCDSCRRHPIVFNLPGHVVNNVLFKPIRDEHSIAVHIPPKDGLGELFVRCSELIHGFCGSLRDESTFHLCQCAHQREEESSHCR